MTIARAQMYRQLYQMGGIGSLPMDYGQSLQVPQQMQPSFSSAQNITMNPLLNYGQPQLGQAGGTPLTMAGGGITRLGYGFGSFVSGSGVAQPVEGGSTSSGGGFGMGLMSKLIQQNPQMFRSQNTNSRYSDFIDINKNGIDDRQEAAYGGRIGYQEGGMDQMMMEPQMQEQAMMQPQQPQQMMEPPLQGMEQSQQPDIKDPKKALEIIIQMLIAQGIPPEQAREIAIQMVQAVAEGGMNEMSDERIGARFGGNMRQNYLFGGIGKAISGVFKGVTNAVKSVVKSDIGKLALTAAAIYATGGGFSPGGFSFMGTPGTLLAGDVMSASTPGLFGNLGLTAGYGTGLGTGTGIMGAIGSGIGNIASGFSGMGIGDLVSKYGTTALIGGAAGALAGGMPQQESGESDADYQRRVNEYKLQYQTAINNPNPKFAPGQFPNNPFYPQRAAEGGRIGYQEGGIGDLIKQTTQEAFFGNNMLAAGGVPTRENQAGVTELDYRKKGGFVPPIGIKEKADDIPAMLSNNEFVFTANAVRNAGRGDVNKGAQRMYGLMKKLEAGGIA